MLACLPPDAGCDEKSEDYPDAVTCGSMVAYPYFISFYTLCSFLVRLTFFLFKDISHFFLTTKSGSIFLSLYKASGLDRYQQWKFSRNKNGNCPTSHHLVPVAEALRIQFQNSHDINTELSPVISLLSHFWIVQATDNIIAGMLPGFQKGVSLDQRWGPVPHGSLPLEECIVRYLHDSITVSPNHMYPKCFGPPLRPVCHSGQYDILFIAYSFVYIH